MGNFNVHLGNQNETYNVRKMLGIDALYPRANNLKYTAHLFSFTIKTYEIKTKHKVNQEQWKSSLQTVQKGTLLSESRNLCRRT